MVPLCVYYSHCLGVFVGLLTMGAVHLCLLCWLLIPLFSYWVALSSLHVRMCGWSFVTSYSVIGLISMGISSFLKKEQSRVDPGERGRGSERLGGGRGRGNCSFEVIFERRISNKIIIINQFQNKINKQSNLVLFSLRKEIL